MLNKLPKHGGEDYWKISPYRGLYVNIDQVEFSHSYNIEAFTSPSIKFSAFLVWHENSREIVAEENSFQLIILLNNNIKRRKFHYSNSRLARVEDCPGDLIRNP